MKTIKLTESQLSNLVDRLITNQPITLSLSSENNMAKINGILYKLRVWAGGILGYQPVQVKKLSKLETGGAVIEWKFDGLKDQSGIDIIPSQDIERVVTDLTNKGEAKWTLKKSGKTVKLIKNAN